MLTREQIESKPGFTIKEIPIPEWDGTVCIRSWTANEMDEYATWVDTGGSVTKKRAHAKIAAISLCDPDGKRMYADGEIDTLGDRNGAALDRIVKEAMSHNGLGSDAIESAEGN